MLSRSESGLVGTSHGTPNRATIPTDFESHTRSPPLSISCRHSIWLGERVAFRDWPPILTQVYICTWRVPLPNSDLPDPQHLQPTFALMAQSTCLVFLSARNQRYPVKSRQ